MPNIPKELLELLANEKTRIYIFILLLSPIGSGFFSWLFTYWKWRSETRRSEDTENFEKYHDLVKELVEGNGGKTYIDRQSAVIYELRFFPKYHNYSLRMLQQLLKTWKNENERLKEEIGLTIQYIEIRASRWKRFKYWITGESY